MILFPIARKSPINGVVFQCAGRFVISRHTVIRQRQHRFGEASVEVARLLSKTNGTRCASGLVVLLELGIRNLACFGIERLLECLKAAFENVIEISEQA